MEPIIIRYSYTASSAATGFTTASIECLDVQVLTWLASLTYSLDTRFQRFNRAWFPVQRLMLVMGYLEGGPGGGEEPK
jgi:hypothetical protein